MSEWWVDQVGTNMLGGVPDDVNNPLRLPDAAIFDFLIHDPEARASFDRLLPTMTADEQTRLQNIARMAEAGMISDPVDTAEELMHKINTAQVRRGGGWRPSSY